LVVPAGHDRAAFSFLKNLPRRTDIEGDDRRAAGEALDHAAGQPFIARSHDDQIEGAIPLINFGLVAGEGDRFAQPCLFSLRQTSSRIIVRFGSKVADEKDARLREQFPETWRGLFEKIELRFSRLEGSHNSDGETV